MLDEADEMLDLGFREDMEFILETTPETRRTLLFSAMMLLQTWHGWRLARRLPKPLNIYLYTGVSAFLPMAIFMLSDNVILYVAWFGNLQFALLGLGYAIAHQVRMAELQARAP